MENPLISISEYLLEKEALLLKIDLSAYLIDYYIHRKDFSGKVSADHDEKLKELLTCLAIHLSIHRSTEFHAWTVHLVAEEPYSLFATGTAGVLDDAGVSHGTMVGHVLTDHIRHTDVNSFHAQFTNTKGKSFKSYVKCESSDIATMVEFFYRQSEQAPLRILLSKTSDTAIALAALPGFDRNWFESVSLEELAQNPPEERKQMRVCNFIFSCECSPEKLLPFFRSLPIDELNDLYGSDPEVTITCPRCGKNFQLSRSEILAQ